MTVRPFAFLLAAFPALAAAPVLAAPAPAPAMLAHQGPAGPERGLRVPGEEEIEGLDSTQHGETIHP